jgi:hypothetical protein
MKLPPSIQIAILTAAAPFLIPSVAAGPLEAYRGLHRLIVVSLPPGPSAEEVTTTLVKQRKQIEERDLKIIDVSEGKHRVSNAMRLPTEQTITLRKQLNLGTGETRPIFILIGKDGGEKARCHGVLNLDKWFAIIDAMPMRRAEIQDQRKSK